MTIKAILDTNVVISGIFWGGAPSKVLEEWQKQRFRLILSAPILEEYRRVAEEIGRKRTTPTLSAILEVIELHAEMVQPVSFVRPVCSDPDDDKFLEAAVAAHADYVVSGDAALLRVKNHQGIEILKAAQLLRLLRR